MSWITVPHLKGKIYIPEKNRAGFSKHPCPDCFACQHCSDERCNACCSKDQTEGVRKTSAVCRK